MYDMCINNNAAECELAMDIAIRGNVMDKQESQLQTQVVTWQGEACLYLFFLQKARMTFRQYNHSSSRQTQKPRLNRQI